MAQQFEAIAFTCEFKAGCDRITKWAGPIRIETHGMPDEFRPNVESIARRVANYTGMDISFVQSGGNVHFWFGKEPRTYKETNATCGTTTTENENSEIIHADIYINHNRVFPFVPSCIIEEFVQSVTTLGNDSDGVFEPVGSIFRNTQWADDLTSTDIMLIKASADGAIKAGMSKREVAPIIRRVLAGLL